MKTNILGVKIDRITLKEALEKTASLLDSKTQHRITTANPEIVLKAWSNGKYLDLVNNSDLVLADGIGLLWAAKFLSLKSSSFVSTVAQLIISGSSLVFSPDYCREVIPERIAGVDLMEKICELASKNGWKVFLLGAGEGTAVETAAALKKKYLDLNIIGSESGGALTEAGELTDESLIGRINSAKPDILFAAFGAPKQDFFLANCLPLLPSVKLTMGVGGAFDFLSGRVKRAPELYRDLGLEWLFRFIHEPWRAIRMFNATVRFAWNVVRVRHLLK